MISKSELRHACFRAKNNSATEKNQIFLDMIKPLLKPGQTWENFATIWDLLIDKKQNIIIIKPEVDYNFIHNTCLTASIFSKKGIEFEFSDRENNIISIVETIMLEGIMTWENYNNKWGIEVDTELKIIKTRLYTAPMNQYIVTDEMIEASKKDADGRPFTVVEPNNVELEVKDLTPEMAESIISTHIKKAKKK